MRFLTALEHHEELRQRTDHPFDCYVREREYLHHLYSDGVKFVVAPALLECLGEAEAKSDEDALLHLRLHKAQYDRLVKEGSDAGAGMLGDPPPDPDEEEPVVENGFDPPEPKEPDETGLSLALLNEMVLRTLYVRGRLSGSEIADHLRLSFNVLAPVLPELRRLMLIDMAGQKGGGVGDSGIQYEIKPPKGSAAVQDALKKTEYAGPCPVPFDVYVATIKAQTIKNMVVTRRTIQKAFSDLVISDDVFNEIGPAVNSAASIFLFGFPGNGKTSIAERITRLMGDDIYIPYAIEANGEIIKIYDPIVHELAEKKGLEEDPLGLRSAFLKGPSVDQRFVRIKRPTIVVGGELTLPMLDLTYNPFGKYYEAPVHMKANGGIFMIDDFGRQQARPMDLLNRWIVPLEKKYDYLTTATGNKIEIPFDQLLIFSTNLDPSQLADEAFLRRIKFKIEIRDPDEAQWREIWRIMCRVRNVEYDDAGIDYLIEKWYKPTNRPIRMCQPRDILDQIISIAKYDMERPTLNPDLIDAGCRTYFVSNEKKDFGAQVRLD